MDRSLISPPCAVCLFLFFAAAATGADRRAAITFDPTPAKIDVDSARTAVLVVDMQNDMCSRGGLLDLMGWDLSGVQRTIAPTARVLTAARQARLPIIYLKGALKPDLSDLPKGAGDLPGADGRPVRAGQTVRAPDGSESRVMIRDTWNSDIIPALKPEAGDTVIYKHRYSGFFETELDATLKKVGVTQLIVVGVTTSVCVESTIRDANFRDYACVLLADCTAEPMGDGRTNYEASLLMIQARLGAVSDSETFIKALTTREGKPPRPLRDASRMQTNNTPLHLAVLRGDADSVDALLAAGADPNALNDAGATSLHYAVASERMVAALLARGARPDVVSNIGVTPLLGAAGKPDSYSVARRLIEAGANLNAQRREFHRLLGPEANVLSLAIGGGDKRTVEFLLERQAELNPKTGPTPLMAAAMAGDIQIARELLKRGADIDMARNLAGTALDMAFLAGNFGMARFLIEQGADLTIPSLRGHATPPIVLSAYNDSGDPTLTKLLVARGVDINTENEAGETALSLALKNGSDTELVRYLVSVGAKRPVAKGREKPMPAREVPSPGEARTAIVRESAQRAVDLLQRNSTAFLENGFVRNVAKCVSCHQQALPAVAFGLARERGLRLDEHEVGRLLAATITGRSVDAETARQMYEPTPGGGLTLGYDADGLRALGYAADEIMESFSRYLLAVQRSDGSWLDKLRRPPMGDGPIVFTAWSLRAVQLYPPAGREREVADAMRRARAWLGQQPIRTHNDRVFQLLGLAWAGEASAKLEPLAGALLSEQRANGGWAQLPGLDCDAWATGSALVALHKAGIAPTHAGYQRGVEFLLRTQFEDGSWWVRSRSWPLQPHFDGKFPHGKDQWISAAGTAWATIALLLTLEPMVSPATLPNGQQLIAAFQKASVEPTRSFATVSANLAPSSAATIEFARDIQPILERSCVGCHGGPRPKAAFTLHSRDALLKGGQSGDPAIVPGNADASPLFRQVSGIVEDLEMPPLNRREKYPAFSADELERLRVWIDSGAPWAPVRTVDTDRPPLRQKPTDLSSR